MKRFDEVRAELLAIIDQEIVAHRQMMSEMVGTLYPSILQDEINKLRDLREKIKE